MRKKWEKNSNESELILKFREKRKWQIALRRYVIQKSNSYYYAPYFGLDIKNIREWFECQFTNDASWQTFGKVWQLDHIIPVTYFDFSDEAELKLCWNFTNLRVELIRRNKYRGNNMDILSSKNYFRDLFNATGYEVCNKMLEKIEQIALTELISTEKQQEFIKTNMNYLNIIQDFSAFEFELLNLGRDVNDVVKEFELTKKLGQEDV